MSLVAILILLLVIGVVFALVPVDAQIKRVIYVILAVLLLLWVLAAFGIIGDYGFYPRHDVIVR